MGLVTLVAGALVSLSTADHGPDAAALRLIIEGALVVLVVVGILTLMRLLIRNKHTDECKRDLDRIRQVFKDHFDEGGLLVGYYPVVQGLCRTARAKGKDQVPNKAGKAGFKSWRALLNHQRPINSIIEFGP